MLLKSKLCLTVLVVYEIIAVTFLHFKRLCDSVFSTAFCDGWYRYFLFCVVVPSLVMLVLMWVRELIRAHRRRAFIRRAKSTVRGVLSNIRGKVSENVDVKDMEKIISAAVLLGVKKYADNHPGLRHNVNNIMDLASGEIDVDIMSVDDEMQKKKKNASSRKKNIKK